jgi:hypothetical protein
MLDWQSIESRATESASETKEQRRGSLHAKYPDKKLNTPIIQSLGNHGLK